MLFVFSRIIPIVCPETNAAVADHHVLQAPDFLLKRERLVGFDQFQGLLLARK